MERTLVKGISGLYAMVTTGILSAPELFAQADSTNMMALAERLGLGLVIAIIGYKVIIKIIDMLGPALIAKIELHDAFTKEKLSSISRKVEKIEENTTIFRNENSMKK